MPTAIATSFAPSLMASLFDTVAVAMTQAAQQVEAQPTLSHADFRALLVVAHHSLYVSDWHIMVMAGLPNNRDLIACRDEGQELDEGTRSVVTSAITDYWRYGHRQPWRVQPPA